MMIEVGIAGVGGTVDHIPFNITKKLSHMNILLI